MAFTLHSEVSEQSRFCARSQRLLMYHSFVHWRMMSKRLMSGDLQQCAQ